MNLRNRCGHILVMALACMATATSQPIAAAQTHKRPPPATDDEALRAALRARGMTELDEKLAGTASPERRESLAASYALEGSKCDDPAERRRLLERAESAYEGLIASRDGKAGLGEADRMALARWRVALASVIVRYSLAADLDRLETTSGLDAPRDRLRPRLEKAVELCAKARVELVALNDALQKDEEHFLLLGLSESLPKLLRECLLNLAWARVWRAAVAPPATDQVKDAAETIRLFDNIAKSPDAAERDSAMIGTAIAMRPARRFDESVQLLDQLIGQNPPYSINVRGHFEKGRTLIAAGRFADARTTLGRLAAVKPEQIPAEHAGARFYVSLAPQLIADSFLLEAKAPGTSAATARQLRERGTQELTRLITQGGPWPELAEIYFTARGIHRDESQRSAPELVVGAQRAMTEEHFEEAAKLWRAALEKLPKDANRAEPAYNLAVCLFQTKQLRTAADAFGEMARMGPTQPLAEKAAYFAYRCRAQLAHESGTAADYAALIDACRLLLRDHPKHPEAREIAWIIPVALQESGRLAEARQSFAAVAADAPRYWEARRRAMVCRQAEFESGPAAASQSAARSAAAATEIADGWRKLAKDIDAATKAGDTRVEATAAREAELCAAELLAGDTAGRYRDALDLIESLRLGDSPERGRALSIRIRCYRGLQQFEKAAGVLDDYVRAVPGDQVGGVLIGLAAGMESEIDRLARAQRLPEARRVAIAAVPTLRQLLAWVEGQPSRKSDVPLVRFSLVRVLECAGDAPAALEQLDRLMQDSPKDGRYVRMAALLNESLGRAATGDAAKKRLSHAEDFWAQLLSDVTLRDRAPDVFWEARYRWLRLRFEAGHASEVARGIEAERAWFPALGGAPWQGKLLELAEEARRRDAQIGK